MAQFRRIRLKLFRRSENETHVIDNPLEQHDKNHTLLQPRISAPLQRDSTVLDADDYQAPLTADSLRAKSGWLIVRHNLHRIRIMGQGNLKNQDRLPHFYLTFQMRRELQRAQDEIKHIDKEKGFYALKEFALFGDKGTKRIFNTSYVTPGDAFIYDRLGFLNYLDP
ncbi:unnamed protein product [Rotaria sp. Silwood1]|nr:unnamed protein product [Rotaria sp. Silwood1]